MEGSLITNPMLSAVVRGILAVPAQSAFCRMASIISSSVTHRVTALVRCEYHLHLDARPRPEMSVEEKKSRT